MDVSHRWLLMRGNCTGCPVTGQHFDFFSVQDVVKLMLEFWDSRFKSEPELCFYALLKRLAAN